MDIASSCLGIACGIPEAVTVIAEAATSFTGSAAAEVSTAAPAFWPLVAGCVGAILASFSGVVADRLPRMIGANGSGPERGLSLSHPPSRCDGCGHRLGAVELVPILGWMIGRGRCRHCSAPVPVVYPVVEAGAFALSAVLVALAGPTWTALALCLCLWVLVAASWVDWKIQEIPDFFTVPLLLLGLLASPMEAEPFARVLGAILAGGFVMLAFALTSRAKDVDAMSYGDVAMALALGAWLGADGAVPFLLASALSYLAYALPLRRKGVVWVPMGPALAAGFVLVAIMVLMQRG